MKDCSQCQIMPPTLSYKHSELNGLICCADIPLYIVSVVALQWRPPQGIQIPIAFAGKSE